MPDRHPATTAPENQTLAHLITAKGEAFAALAVAHVPRAGDTVSHPEAPGVVWRVRRVHWPLEAAGVAELHLVEAVVSPEGA